MSDRPLVTLEVDRGVALVALARPEQRNALDLGLKVALAQALESVAGDEAVRAVLLTGEGQAFCVGQDLGEHARLLHDDPATALRTVDEHYAPIVTTLMTMPKPVVGAVNGACVGAGLGLALACDLRVLSETATLGTAFTGIGLTCDSAVSATLVQAVGRSRASELVLLARTFTSAEATSWGISGEVVPAEEVLPRARELAARLAAGPTRAYAESKALLNGAPGRSLAATLTAESVAQQRLGLTSDHQDAVRAFLAKQRPVFSGR